MVVQWDIIIMTEENDFDCGPREDLSEEATFELRKGREIQGVDSSLSVIG